MPPIIPAPSDIPVDNDDSGNVPYATNVNVSHINGVAMNVNVSDSESDNEGWDHNGYEPLSQDPLSLFSPTIQENDDSFSDSEEPVADIQPTFRIITPDDPPVLESDIVECSTETIPMTQEHIDKIKAVMRDVRLPSSNMPEWASEFPEDEWKVVVTKYMTTTKNSYTYKRGSTTCPAPSTSNDKSDMSNEVLR